MLRRPGNRVRRHPGRRLTLATYAIGDIQGCWESLRALLKLLPFRPGLDRLWLAGDLVNRGPGSLEVLRWASQRDDVTAVLGNHDMHLLAAAFGHGALRPTDTLDRILGATDRDRLIAWLQRRPFLVEQGDLVLVHAGLHPSWSLAEARARARAAERALRTAPDLLLAGLYEKNPDDRDLATIRTMTNIRTCRESGRPRWGFKGPPDAAPPGSTPWFEQRGPTRGNERVVFGHWAALGLLVRRDVVGLDTGCVWGGQLTAVRLNDDKVFRVTSRDRLR